MTVNELKKEFVLRFGGKENDVRIFSAAGRINLIGEHVDYCGGPVLPAALNLRCLVAAKKTNGNTIRLQATTISKTAELNINTLNDYRDLEWGEYQAGVAYVMQNDGYTITACDLLYDTDVPFGSGLSSSAAIEVASALTFSTFSSEAGGKKGTLKELAVLSQKAENEYANVNCGIMDQFASAMGKKNNAIFLDCASLKYSYVPIDFKEYSMVIANSNKKRSLQESKYNERRAECETAFSLLKTKIDGITCLADISVEQFNANKSVLSGKILDRAEHVVYECDRVNKSVEALKNGKIKEFGDLLNQSHMSLKDKYEVTGIELDTLTKLSREHFACVGSRMTGAGFGGCTISIVKTADVDDFIKSVSKAYKKATGLTAEFYNTSVEDGAFEII